MAKPSCRAFGKEALGCWIPHWGIYRSYLHSYSLRPCFPLIHVLPAAPRELLEAQLYWGAFLSQRPVIAPHYLQKESHRPQVGLQSFPGTRPSVTILWFFPVNLFFQLWNLYCTSSSCWPWLFSPSGMPFLLQGVLQEVPLIGITFSFHGLCLDLCCNPGCSLLVVTCVCLCLLLAWEPLKAGDLIYSFWSLLEV